MSIFVFWCSHIGGSNNRECLLKSTIESPKVKKRLSKNAIYGSIRCSHVLVKHRDQHSFRNLIRPDHQTDSFIHNDTKKANLNSPKVSNKMLVNNQENTKSKHNGMQKSLTNSHSKGFLEQGTNNSTFHQRRDEKPNNKKSNEQKVKTFNQRSASGT